MSESTAPLVIDVEELVLRGISEHDVPAVVAAFERRLLDLATRSTLPPSVAAAYATDPGPTVRERASHRPLVGNDALGHAAADALWRGIGGEVIR